MCRGSKLNKSWTKNARISKIIKFWYWRMFDVCKILISHKRLVSKHFPLFDRKYGGAYSKITLSSIYGKTDTSIVILTYEWRIMHPFCKRSTLVSRIPVVVLWLLMNVAPCYGCNYGAIYWRCEQSIQILWCGQENFEQGSIFLTTRI